ncbi:hypothetical protein F4805DRAFT_137232 [Annulohypoxylon moriforme]|nr:hypothetical protein F4805DRAFT_137232 [Annulohypoxylon moriforme]
MESPPEQTHQRRGPWSQREDELLRHYVAIQGPLCWVRISAQIGTRSSKQCRERYHQNLKPSLNHNPISAEEGAQIEEMVGKIGKRWAEIARSLNNRSDNAVKNWWNGSMNRRRRLIRRQNSTLQEPLPPNQTQSAYYTQGTPQLPLPLPQHQHQQHHHHAEAAQATHPPPATSLCTLNIATFPSHPKKHGQHSLQNPSHQSQQTTGPWGGFSGGLLSPSLTSPSVEPQEPPHANLASNSNSKVGATYSPSSSHERPPTLPPLRIGNGELPASQLPPLSSRAGRIQPDFSNVRLPPIRDYVGSTQLLTAPNSPRGHSQGPEPQVNAQTPEHEGEQGSSSPRRKVSIRDLLS